MNESCESKSRFVSESTLEETVSITITEKEQRTMRPGSLRLREAINPTLENDRVLLYKRWTTTKQTELYYRMN
jgi:hypothetical protein